MVVLVCGLLACAAFGQSGSIGCLSHVPSPETGVPLEGGPWRFERPIEVNFMCDQGMILSLVARDMLRDLLRDLGVGGVTVTNQGAFQGADDDHPVFTETESTRRLWGKQYVIKVTPTGDDHYRATAARLRTSEGRNAIAAALRADGQPPFAGSVADGNDASVPQIWRVDQMGVANYAVTSVPLAQAILRRVIREEAAKGNRLVPAPPPPVETPVAAVSTIGS